jgi:hypothetical protein
MSEEAWQEHLEEMRAYAKRIWKQSGGRLDVSPSPASPPPRKS